MTTISAKTILRSRNASAPGKVLSTLLLRYPRFIHAEMMTHRVFSRNSASSRAIPVKKLIDDVVRDPAMPIFWGKNQPGMQAGEEHNEPVWIVSQDFDPENYCAPNDHKMTREAAWLVARDYAVSMATRFADAGYHKQIVNRLLEPFAHITVLISATEWSNFLELRDHPDAEPHIQMLAREIRKCLERTDDIQDLEPGEWHMPFVGDVDDPSETLTTLDFIKLSVARCASTSYRTTDGFDMTLERAAAIYDKLITSKPMHCSPAEHQAVADQRTAAPWGDAGRRLLWENPEQHGNFEGFCQYRHML